ncbi:hypothetical protein D9M71_266810 [compost metagenome]
MQQRLVGFAQAAAGAVQGVLEVLGILLGAAAGAGIGAVDRKVHDQLQQRPADGAQGQVAGGDIATGHLQQTLGHGFQVAGQGAGQQGPACLSRFFEEIAAAAADRFPQCAEAQFAKRVVLQQRYLVHEFVAGTAIHVPADGQAFAVGEDLLDVEGEMPFRQRRWTPGQQAAYPAAQAPAVAARIGQAIDMVDAQAVHQAPLDQLEDLGMGGFENVLALHAQAAQLIDIEEAPPVDVVGGGAPAGQAVGLALQQQVQALEAVFAAAVERHQRRFEVGAFLHQTRQLGLQR